MYLWARLPVPLKKVSTKNRQFVTICYVGCTDASELQHFEFREGMGWPSF